MKKLAILLSVFALCATAEGSWYWPFGGGKEKPKQRVSELLEPASALIDQASDFADAGKIDEAVETYRKALVELDRIEAENADRAQSAAFATLRNKRAYVNAAIDSLLFKQANQNARAVSVTDTTELEKKLAAAKGVKPPAGPDDAVNVAEKKDDGNRQKRKTPVVMEDGKPVKAVTLDAANAERRAKLDAALKKAPQNRRVRLLLAAECIRTGDHAEAQEIIAKLLAEKPDDPSALNLRAAMEMDMGEDKKAEATLEQAISSNPKSHFAYYNMARLILKTRGSDEIDKATAKDYYETGRKLGGPVDKALEGQF